MKHYRRASQKLSPRARVVIALALIAGSFYIIGTLDTPLRIIMLAAFVLVIGGMYK